MALLASYSFDETGGTVVHDGVGNLDGVFTDVGPAFVAGGVSGNALSLTRAQPGFVSMGDVLRLGDLYTISVWIRTTSTEGDYVLSRHLGEINNGYIIGVNVDVGNNGAPTKAWAASSTYGPHPVSTTTVNDGAWHMLTAVRDPDFLYLFVDGQFEARVRISGARGDLDGIPFVIGSTTNPGGTPGPSRYTGLVDELRIYDTALSGPEVAQLYADQPREEVPTAWADRLVGTAGGESIDGLDGADTIRGLAGNDALTGSGGDDGLDGGEDADTLNGGAGNDRLEGGAGADSLVGGLGLDRLAGGEGADTLRGGAEADTLIGGAGDDTFLLDTVANLVVEEADGGIDTAVRRGGTYTLGAHIENFLVQGSTGTGGTGNAMANVMTGGGGADTLSGLGGADRLAGNAGGDLLRGGDGADTIDGGAGDDRLEGGNDADSLAGGAGADTLAGGAGTDTLVGGEGNDVYLVDSIADLVVELEGGGVDTVVRTAGSYTLGAGIENFLVQGSLGARGTGNALANVLTGGGGADTLLGGGGNDVLVGGAGGDALTGGAGADLFRFEALGDSPAGLPGRDRIADFSVIEGDRIDLSAIDADATQPGDQAFVLAAGALTGQPGEIAILALAGSLSLEADVTGDGLADFVLTLTGTPVLTAAQFIL